MRTLAAMLVTLAACIAPEPHCNLLCDDDASVTAHTQIHDLIGDTIVVCVNGTTCANGVIDAACVADFSCMAEGAFAASLSAGDAGAVRVDVSAYVAKADGDVWSISIVDADGAQLFSDQAPVTYNIEPQPCFDGPPCHNLMLDL